VRAVVRDDAKRVAPRLDGSAFSVNDPKPDCLRPGQRLIRAESAQAVPDQLVGLLSRYENFTMSLSAIAGLVVAIGITADSFIVYFERLRDAIREGSALRPAAESGWKRARRTILTSDTVSFLAAVLLYHFAVSDVQGFAYTLGLTTLIDILVVFLFTKPMVTLLAGTRFYGGGHRWSGLDPARLGAKTPWRSSTR
jgi:preprotein translocase subunit SecD